MFYVNNSTRVHAGGAVYNICSFVRSENDTSPYLYFTQKHSFKYTTPNIHTEMNVSEIIMALFHFHIFHA